MMTTQQADIQHVDIRWPMAVAAVTVMAFYALLLRKFALFGPASSSLSQLPVIMHFADPQVLAADWYTQSMSGLSPRYFYFRTMAVLAGVVGLPAAYVAGQVVALVSVGVVTLYGAVKAFNLSRTAGAIAGMLAVSVSAFNLGSNVEIINNTFIPKSIATPLGLLAMVLAMRGSYLGCAIAGAAGSLFQPVYGLFPGAMALISVAIVRPWRSERESARARSAVARLALGLAIITGVAAWWSSLAGVDVGPDEAVQIVAFIRNPHHFRFSAQPASAWALALCLLTAGTAMVICWRRIAGEDAKRDLALRTMLEMCGLIALMWVVGFFAIEVIPSKLGLALQPMRYVFIPLWLCIIATAAVATHFLLASGPLARWGWSLCLLAGNAWTQPLLLLIGSISALRVSRESSEAELAQSRDRAGKWLLVPALVVTVAAFASSGKIVQLVCGLVVALLALGLTRKFQGDARATVFSWAPLMGLGLVATIVWGLPGLSPRSFAAIAAFLPTEERIVQRAAERDRGFAAILDISRQARELTPKDAVFLTPPNFGPFRIVARRAIVVDFKAWPFRTPGAWLERLTDCYGETEGEAGFELVESFARRYREVDDVHLRAIAERYSATHAVLYRETPSAFPTLAEGDVYRIVSLVPES